MNEIKETRQAGDLNSGVAEIVVTPEMIEAGIDEFLKAYPDTGCGDRLDAEMVRSIFLAMAASRSSVPASP